MLTGSQNGLQKTGWCVSYGLRVGIGVTSPGSWNGFAGGGSSSSGARACGPVAGSMSATGGRRLRGSAAGVSCASVSFDVTGPGGVGEICAAGIVLPVGVVDCSAEQATMSIAMPGMMKFLKTDSLQFFRRGPAGPWYPSFSMNRTIRQLYGCHRIRHRIRNSTPSVIK